MFPDIANPGVRGMRFAQAIYGRGLHRKLVRSHLHVASVGIVALTLALLALLWIRNRTRKLTDLLTESVVVDPKSITDERLRLEMIENAALVVFLVMIPVMAIFGWLEARRRATSLMKPINALQQATRKFAEGELHEDVPIQSHDQLGELTESFNAMRATIQEKEEALVRSNEELQRFAYVASHDLQAPLRAVSGFVQLLHRTHGDRLDERGIDWVKRTVQAAGRMQSLIDDLLKFSRVGSQAAEFKPLKLNEVVDEALEILQSEIEETGAEIEVQQLPELAGDRSQLTQLFQNLIGNGLKYQEKGARPRIVVSAERIGTAWEFSVRDNGIGIAEEHRERVFESFRRLHTAAEYSGTGIGLAVCRRVVERHGGKIRVEANPEGGSDFRFTIAANLLQSESREPTTDEIE